MPEPTLPPYRDRQERYASLAVRVLSALDVSLYRATAGRIGGRFLRGAPVMLLTTEVRTSGLPRTVALIDLEKSEDIVVVASEGEMSEHQARTSRNIPVVALSPC